MFNRWEGLLAWFPVWTSCRMCFLAAGYCGHASQSSGTGCYVHQWGGWGWSSELVTFPVWVWRVCSIAGTACDLWFKSGRTANWTLWPDETTCLDLWIRRTTGWDFCSGAAISRNVVWWDLNTGCHKPKSLSVYVTPSSWALQIPLVILMRWDLSNLPGKDLAIWGIWMSFWILFLSLEKLEALGAPLHVAKCSLGCVWCGQNEVPPLSLLIVFFSASAAHGRASASLCISETSIMVSYSWIVACWSSCEMDSN